MLESDGVRPRGQESVRAAAERLRSAQQENARLQRELSELERSLGPRGTRLLAALAGLTSLWAVIALVGQWPSSQARHAWFENETADFVQQHALRRVRAQVDFLERERSRIEKDVQHGLAMGEALCDRKYFHYTFGDLAVIYSWQAAPATLFGYRVGFVHQERPLELGKCAATCESTLESHDPYCGQDDYVATCELLVGAREGFPTR